MYPGAPHSSTKLVLLCFKSELEFEFTAFVLSFLKQLQGVVDPWDVFKDNHVGVWRGIWETFDNIGDKIDTSEV